ncbi:hypothetical protein LVD15_09935 [Fulvivirga maritima]|uniref:hypothetical protein n=1 Tax=Fulvivirga maritima TaxID=2904247 RepID=UPI001F209BB6|nr:hypothetical protein [Fulvivirga maritima]UII28721.1 hypothetical protein LVD15_09935 [Fulvivirga maritima]
MAVKTLLQESYCDITFDDSTKVVTAQWIGFLKTDQVKKGCELMTKFIKENEIKLHLSDHRRLKVLSKEVQEYLGGSWFPEVESIGLTKLAVLVSDDVFAKATVDKVNETAVGSLKIHTFNAEKDCFDWFKEGEYAANS